MTDLPIGAHEHVFLGDDHDRNTRRTWVVIGLTAVMMVIEITAGTMFGSMALVADGWHMSTHAAALLIAALAYGYARKNARNPRFTFGTGKIGDLAGFASAVILALIALLIGWESLVRLYSPVAINFTQAITVAVIGLAVNLVSAFILGANHDHGHGHGHDHHDHGHHHDHPHPHEHTHHRRPDNNLRAAYLHVLADALTSVLAIGALLAGSLFGWNWLDPAIGIVGALVIARWSWGLIRDAGRVLVDYNPASETLPRKIREAVESEADRITDLHVWQVGPGRHAAIVSIASATPQAVDAYKAKMAGIDELVHVTVEVRPA